MFDFEDTKGVTRSRKTKDRQYNIGIRTKHLLIDWLVFNANFSSILAIVA
jgi:hypothetical protein